MSSSDSEDSEPSAGDADAAAAPALPHRRELASGTFGPRLKTLVVAVRGVAPRHRHVMQDLVHMMPTARTDNKLDSRDPVRLGLGPRERGSAPGAGGAEPVMINE